MMGHRAQDLCLQVLQRCEPNQAEVLLLVKDESLTRFANNAIHQNVSERNVTLIARVIMGNRIGTATTNRLEDADLDRVVARARLNASASPEDPNYPGLAEPAAYTPVAAHDKTTADYPPEARAKAVGVVCRLASEKGLNAFGAFTTGQGEVAVANSRGVYAYHASTHADFQTVVTASAKGVEASGRAQASGWRAAELPVEALGKEAIQKAERGIDPRSIEPGEYTVVCDPYVTQDLISLLNYYGMSAQAVLEGRSWMNDRIGQQAMSPLVNILDDGLDLDGYPMPFDFEGVPKSQMYIVRGGVVGGPVYDRYTAHKAEASSTGHALPPSMRGTGPLATNLFMTPGSTSLDEMIRSTERGLYITRFWYTRLVHPRDCVVTGMTRDGVFMIEKGELSYPVKNLRFTHSYVQALADVEAVGKETRLLLSDFGRLAVRVPALKISRFNFTGSTV